MQKVISKYRQRVFVGGWRTPDASGNSNGVPYVPDAVKTRKSNAVLKYQVTIYIFFQGQKMTHCGGKEFLHFGTSSPLSFSVPPLSQRLKGILSIRTRAKSGVLDACHGRGAP